MNSIQQSESDVKLEIGSTVWVKDSNYRKYDNERRIIYREHFRSVQIEDETSRSWIIKYKGRKLNINKTILEIGSTDKAPGLSCFVYLSEQKVNEQCWIRAHQSKLADEVMWCKDYKTLRQIAALLDAAKQGA